MAAKKTAKPKAEKKPKPPKKDKPPKSGRRAQDAANRRERKTVARTVREGTRAAKKSYRAGNKGCRDTRKAANEPHRKAIAQNKVDFEGCRARVADLTLPQLERLGPSYERLSQLDRILPAPVPRGPSLNAVRYGEQVERAVGDILQSHPELSPFFQGRSGIGEIGRYGTREARDLRKSLGVTQANDPRIGDRIAEILLQEAHEIGWSPQSGLHGAPSLQLMAQERADESVRRMMAAGPPSPLSAGLAMLTDPLAMAMGEPRSSVAPSLVTSSMMRFPGTVSTGSATLDAHLAASGRPAPSSRAGAPSRRPTSGRGATSARGQGPVSRAPPTQVSPSSARRKEAPKRAPSPKRAGAAFQTAQARFDDAAKRVRVLREGGKAGTPAFEKAEQALGARKAEAREARQRAVALGVEVGTIGAGG